MRGSCLTGRPLQSAVKSDGSTRAANAADREPILHREWKRVLGATPWLAMVIDRNFAVLEHSPDLERVLVDPLPVIVQNRFLEPNGRDAERKMAEFFDRLGPGPQRLMVGDVSGRNWVLLRGWLIEPSKDWTAVVHCITSQPIRDLRDTELPRQFGLTQAESIILNQIAALKKPATIARELQISESTVRSHLKQLHVKLEVDSAQQLLLKARAFCNT
jgi:DNA-binding CsgD family transcriptional regulator